MFDVKSFYKIFVHIRKDNLIFKSHPLFKLLGTCILFIAILFSTLKILLIIMILILIECLIGQVLGRLLDFLRSIKAFLIFLTILALLLYKPITALIIILRVITSGFAIILFIATTDSERLIQALDQIGIPHRFIYPFQLALRVIPFIANDAISSLEALTLKKKIKPGIIVSGLTTALAVIVANAVERSKYLSEALISKFYGASSRRTYIDELRITKYDILQLLIKTLLLCYVIFPQYFMFLGALLFP